MSASDLRAKTQDELKTELLSLRKEQLNLRFQRANAQLQNTARLRVVRRTIAQIKTVLGEKLAGVVVTASAKKATPSKTEKKAETKKAAPKAKAAKKEK